MLVRFVGTEKKEKEFCIELPLSDLGGEGECGVRIKKKLIAHVRFVN